jgi:NAD(P)-dependent dehydrogenase (short-subunit alcohol dehydrogenase family)
VRVHVRRSKFHPNVFRLVNNAGVGLEARYPALCHLTDEETWDVTMNVNAKSVFLGCKYATAQMLKQEAHPSGDRGWIINMSSIMGIIAGQDNRKLIYSHLKFVLTDN